jgi:hypothetical protein
MPLDPSWRAYVFRARVLARERGAGGVWAREGRGGGVGVGPGQGGSGGIGHGPNQRRKEGREKKKEERGSLPSSFLSANFKGKKREEKSKKGQG